MTEKLVQKCMMAARGTASNAATFKMKGTKVLTLGAVGMHVYARLLAVS